MQSQIASLIYQNLQRVHELDVEQRKGHRKEMKAALFLLFSCSVVLGQMPPRQPVPEVIRIEAQKATQVLMNRVVKGDIDAAFKHMNSKWKKIEARKNGGEAKLNRKFSEGFADLQAKGITLRATQSKFPSTAYEVDFGHQEQIVNGERIKVGVYKQWMVFVPTVSQVTAVDRGAVPPEIVEMRLDSFQIALCEKGKNDWTFIDGAHIKGAELRQLFPFLPKDEEKLGFPKRGGRVLKIGGKVPANVPGQAR